MGLHAECGRGWSARCANSKGRTCRCRCGGANHGKLSGGQAAPSFVSTAIGRRGASYRLEKDTPQYLVIRDVGPWDKHPSVTNDAEQVVQALAERLGQRRLFYYDSSGQLDEIKHDGNGKFLAFHEGGPT